MKRDPWPGIGLGSVTVWLVLRAQRRNGESFLLGPPIVFDGVPRITPHGHFGARRVGPPAHAHQGIDIAAHPGSHVLAVGDGVIVKTDPGLGKTVRKLRLDAPAAWDFAHRRVDSIVYADLGTPLVRPGDRVHKGDAIAVVDKAGFVHFAVKESRPSGEVFFDPQEAGLAYRLSSPLVS